MTIYFNFEIDIVHFILKNNILLFLAFSLLQINAIAQEDSAFEIAFLSGGNIGWWGHNHGQNAAGEYTGWDRSHTAIKIPFELQFWWNISPKFSIGLNANYDLFFDSYMKDHRSTRNNSINIYFSDKEYLGLWSTKFMTRYALFANEKFKLGPQLALGYGNTLSTHPDQARFKKNIVYSAAFFFHWHLQEKLSLIFLPNYEVLQIFPENRKPKEQHKLSFYGIKIGLAWRI